MKIESKEVTLIDITKLKPYPHNSNKHPEDQIDALIKLIEYQGFRDPLTVCVDTNFIIAGEGRYLASKKMGAKKVPVIFQKFKDEQQRRAHNTAHNAISEWSQIDVPTIDTILKEFPEMDKSLLGIKDLGESAEVVNMGDENTEWAKGMPEFNASQEGYIRLTYIFASEKARENFVKKNNVDVETRLKNVWLVYPK